MAETTLPVLRRDSWIGTSHRIIDDALKDVPLSATEKEIRAILKPLYPFGERKYHPYKQWCQAIRTELKRRNLLSDPDMTPRLLFTASRHCIFTEGIGPSHWIDGYLSIKVFCRYCNDLSPDIAGCLMCREEYTAAQAINGHDCFNGLARNMRKGDPLAQGLLADWLAERGYEELSKQVRAYKMPQH